MGFDEALAQRALHRANNDWDSALTMLTAGMVPEEDEFDLLHMDEKAPGTPVVTTTNKPKPKVSNWICSRVCIVAEFRFFHNNVISSFHHGIVFYFVYFYQEKSEDHFRAGVPKDAPESAIIDSRVQQLMEMGFSGKDAENALRAAKNDFGRAVEMLTADGLDDLSA
jgi:uncharacterized UBP type Zn finger protein